MGNVNEIILWVVVNISLFLRMTVIHFVLGLFRKQKTGKENMKLDFGVKIPSWMESFQDSNV